MVIFVSVITWAHTDLAVACSVFLYTATHQFTISPFHQIIVTLTEYPEHWSFKIHNVPFWFFTPRRFYLLVIYRKTEVECNLCHLVGFIFVTSQISHHISFYGVKRRRAVMITDYVVGWATSIAYRIWAGRGPPYHIWNRSLSTRCNMNFRSAFTLLSAYTHSKS